MAAINLQRAGKFDTRIEMLQELKTAEWLNLRNEILSWDIDQVKDILGEMNVLNVGFIKKGGGLFDNDQCFDELTYLSDLSRVYFWTVFNEQGERADSHIDYWFYYDESRGMYFVEFYGAKLEEKNLDNMLKVFLYQLTKEGSLQQDQLDRIKPEIAQ